MATEERETAGLIGSDKVEGTNVYGATGEKIGSIERVMIDKRSGHVAYAVLSFGGFLGIGSDYYPIPWTSYHLSTPICHIFTPSARPAHDESGSHHSTYDDAAWPSGYAAVGRQ
jgi:PRC-barrel domain